METFMQIFVVALLMLAWVVIGLFLWFQKGTHRFVAKEKGKDHSLTKVYWMVEKELKDGSRRWVSWPFRSIKILPPSAEVVEFLPWGKKIATGYLMSKDEVMWVKTDLSDKNSKALESFIPFSAQQRAALVNEYEKSELEKLNKLTIGQIVIQIAPMVILAGVIIMGIVFAGDIFTSYRQTLADYNGIVKNQERITLSQAKILDAMGYKTGVEIPQDVKPSTGETVTQTQNEQPPAILNALDKL